MGGDSGMYYAGSGGGAWGTAVITGGAQTATEWANYSGGGKTTLHWSASTDGTLLLQSGSASASYSFDIHSRLSGSGSYDRVVDGSLTLHGTWLDSASADITDSAGYSYALVMGIWVGTSASGRRHLTESHSYSYHASGSYSNDSSSTSNGVTTTWHADRSVSETDSASASYDLDTTWQWSGSGPITGTQKLSASGGNSASWSDTGSRSWSAQQSSDGSSSMSMSGSASNGWSNSTSNWWSGSGGSSGSWSESFTHDGFGRWHPVDQRLGLGQLDGRAALVRLGLGGERELGRLRQRWLRQHLVQQLRQFVGPERQRRHHLLLVAHHAALDTGRAGPAGQRQRRYQHAPVRQRVVGLQFDDHDDHDPACFEQCVSISIASTNAADPERVAADTCLVALLVALLQRQRHNECDHDFDFELLVERFVKLQLDHLGIGIRLLWLAGRIWWRAIGAGNRQWLWRLGAERLALAARFCQRIGEWIRQCSQ